MNGSLIFKANGVGEENFKFVSQTFAIQFVINPKLGSNISIKYTKLSCFNKNVDTYNLMFKTSLRKNLHQDEQN